MRANGLLVVAVGTLVGCATTSSTGSTSQKATEEGGLSCARRVKVAAISEEYSWVKEHYPGAKVRMQTLSRCGESPTDKLHITTVDGRDVTVHFDISSFF